jgi:hypothetical protein
MKEVIINLDGAVVLYVHRDRLKFIKGIS